MGKPRLVPQMRAIEKTRTEVLPSFARRAASSTAAAELGRPSEARRIPADDGGGWGEGEAPPERRLRTRLRPAGRA